MPYEYGSAPGFGVSVSYGLISGFTRASGIGYNPDVDTGTAPEDAWGAPGMYPWLSGLTSLEVVSTSALDTAAGTGARTVTFFTLTGDYVATSQTVTLNGTTPVPLPIDCIRNNGGRCIQAGSAGVNQGDIILRDAGGGAIRGIILAGLGFMRQAPYTVPQGYTLAIPYILLAVDTPTGSVGKFASIDTWFKAPGQSSVSPLHIGNTNGSPYNHFSDPPIMAAERTDFALTIISASDNNTIVTAGWNGYLKRNVAS